MLFLKEIFIKNLNNNKLSAISRNITGIILAGGKSSRMGTNKALLKIEREPIISLLIKKIENFFNNIIIISNSPNEFEFTGKKVFEDYYPGFGPLAGIHSGLKNSTTEKNFIISCDLLLINSEAIDYLLKFNTQKEAILYKEKSFIQPLCGIYYKRVFLIAESLLKNYKTNFDHNMKIKLRVSDLLNKIKVEEIPIENLPFYSNKLFFNMNYKKDFNDIKKLLIKIKPK